MSKSTDENINAICITPSYISTSTIFTIYVVTLLVSILYIFYLTYLKKSEQGTSSDNKGTSRNSCGLLSVLFTIIFITSAFNICFYGLLKWEYCFKYYANSEITFVIILFPYWLLFYEIQNICLCLLFYIKIRNIFKDTSFQLSNRLEWFYKILFLFLLFGVIFLLIWLFFIDTDNNFKYLFVGTMLIYITAILSLTILFIQRLIMIYKTQKSQESQILINQITRLTILVSISMIISLLWVIVILIEAFTRTLLMEYIASIFGVADLYTNWIIVMLTDKRLQNIYNKICGPLHKKCNQCWINIIDIGNDNQKNLEKYQESECQL